MELAIKYIKRECGRPPRVVDVEITWCHYISFLLTRVFSQSELKRKGFQRTSPAGLGAGDLEFKSPRPTKISPVNTW
jgi:hypothetical protein